MNPKAALNFAIKAALMFVVGAAIVNTIQRRVPVAGALVGRVTSGL